MTVLILKILGRKSIFGKDFLHKNLFFLVSCEVLRRIQKIEAKMINISIKFVRLEKKS
jgi:hypothetical protein